MTPEQQKELDEQDRNTLLAGMQTAFPVVVNPPKNPMQPPMVSPGVTMRDYFAIRVLVELIRQSAEGQTATELPRMAYAIADAMVRTRKETQDELSKTAD
jgi:hypothetical protein